MVRSPKPITRARLLNIGRHHLERWPTARAHLRRVLVRRVDKAVAAHAQDREEALAWVDEVLDTLEAEGRLSDPRYATGKAASLHGRGVSRLGIEARLRSKGVGSAQVKAAVSELGPQADRRAAAALVRRRRMGPWRVDPAPHHDKDLARLVRAGFGFGLAKELLALDRDTLEEIELSAP